MGPTEGMWVSHSSNEEGKDGQAGLRPTDPVVQRYARHELLICLCSCGPIPAAKRLVIRALRFDNIPRLPAYLLLLRGCSEVREEGVRGEGDGEEENEGDDGEEGAEIGEPGRFVPGVIGSKPRHGRLTHDGSLMR